MKRFAIGVLVGLVLGLTVSALAADVIITWASGTKVMSAPRHFRSGYAAGASDMLKVVAENAKDYPESAPAWFIRQAACLEKKRGGDLGQFTDFAESLWRGRDFAAASILLERACQ